MPETNHHSYMLRLWRERAEMPWRAMLIAVEQPDARQHFDTLEDCFAWLQARSVTIGGPGRYLDGSTVIVAQMEATEK
jgi:hypothetical protein